MSDLIPTAFEVGIQVELGIFDLARRLNGCINGNNDFIVSAYVGGQHTKA